MAPPFQLRAMARVAQSVSITAILAAAPPAEANDVGPTSFLDTITVVAKGVSNMLAASVGDIGQAEIAGQPLLRPGAVLENVPGLIVTQHSGEGKANQYFLRAFNLDHGTDLASELDDMPLNLPTHAHGQGYTDLNFLIPELVADLHYKKGPYYADEGDFATAGAVRMGLMNATPPSATLGYGEDGFRRALLMGSTALASGTLLAAGDFYHNDGPFQVPDDYLRLNGVLRYHQGTDQSFWTLTGMAYSGRWTSTDQVPERAIDAGIIDRFGSLNPTDGGDTTRMSLSFNRVDRTEHAQSQLSAYVIRYKLDLYSTFTSYLKDPVNGDQMLQHDDRVVYGFKGSKTWYTKLGDMPVSNLLGLQVRVDDIRDVGIFPTFERRILGTEQDASVTEATSALYIESSIEWRPWLRTALGLRGDAFEFRVRDKLTNPNGSCDFTSDPLGCNTGTRRAGMVSPKLGIVLGPWAKTTFYLNAADGYHSNDARGVTRSGENPDNVPVTPLTRTQSAEVGLSTTPVRNWQLSLDLFQLKLESELVFDGNAGVTSPSGSTTRTGIELGNTFRLTRWLTGDFNAAFSKGRFNQNAPPDALGCADAAPSHRCLNPAAITGRYIPNSPTNVIDAGLTANGSSRWFGAIRARHFGESPLVEDNSARSPAYTTVDMQVGYRGSAHWLVALDVFNVFNVHWNDIVYYYESRLANEPSPQPDYVAHPGVPRTIRLKLHYQL